MEETEAWKRVREDVNSQGVGVRARGRGKAHVLARLQRWDWRKREREDVSNQGESARGYGREARGGRVGKGRGARA